MINRYLFKIKKDIEPFRTAIVTVFISVAASAIISAMSDTGKIMINNEMDSMGFNGLAATAYNQSGNNVTDNDFYTAICDLNNIINATPVITENSAITFKNNKIMNVLCWGIAPDAAKVVSLEVVNGRMINNADIQRNAFVCLIDENIAYTAYNRADICGKTIQVSINGDDFQFMIIGTVRKTSSVLNSITGGIVPDFIYIPYTTMKNISSKSSFDQIIFTTSDTEKTEDFFKNKTSKSNHLFKTNNIVLTDLSQQKEQITNITDIAFLSLFAVSCISVLVCSMAVGASVNTAVISRQKDIGIKMSMGASVSNIILEFMTSALIACIIGVSSALAVVIFIVTVLNVFIESKISIDYSLILFSVFATIILTAVFSFIPSCKAANLPPIKALNRE